MIHGYTPAVLGPVRELAAKNQLKVVENGAGEEDVISINTVKTHLKSILGKTETSRQAELVALLLRSMGALRDD